MRWGKRCGDGRFYDLEHDAEERPAITGLTGEMRVVRARFEGVLAKYCPMQPTG